MIPWIADHLDAIGGYRACLLASILAAWDGLGPHVGGLGRYPGHGLSPGLARGPQNGLDCIEAGAGALFYQDPGIHAPVKVEGDLSLFGLTIN